MAAILIIALFIFIGFSLDVNPWYWIIIGCLCAEEIESFVSNHIVFYRNSGDDSNDSEDNQE